MKMNPDLLRAILLYAEKHEDDNDSYLVAKIDDYTPKEIGRHTKLLAEDDFLDLNHVKHTSDHSMHDVFIRRLTKKGHDFIAAYREPKVWKKVKTTLLEKGIGITMEALFNAMLKQYQ